ESDVLWNNSKWSSCSLPLEKRDVPPEVSWKGPPLGYPPDRLKECTSRADVPAQKWQTSAPLRRSKPSQPPQLSCASSHNHDVRTQDPLGGQRPSHSSPECMREISCNHLVQA